MLRISCACREPVECARRFLLRLLVLAVLTGCGVERGASPASTSRTEACRPRCTAVTASTPVRRFQPTMTWQTAEIAYFRGEGYTPDRQIAVRLKNGMPLHIVHSVCTGSADGYCQAIDVFRARSQKPMWHRQYTEVLAIHPLNNGFAIRAATYGPNDPFCCPSGRPITTTYLWSGHAFVKWRPPAPSKP